jgi:hypothetical protein
MRADTPDLDVILAGSRWIIETIPAAELNFLDRDFEARRRPLVAVSVQAADL